MWNWITEIIIEHPNLLIVGISLISAIAFARLFWAEIKEENWFED